jgi:hypothetical protein
MMLVTFCSLSLLFASGMAPQTKKGEMLSTEELQRNHQPIGSWPLRGLLPACFEYHWETVI